MRLSAFPPLLTLACLIQNSITAKPEWKMDKHLCQKCYVENQ